MLKLLKILASLIGLILVLVLTAALVAPFVIDPNDFRAEIAEAVASATGRDLAIDGAIHLSVFPWLGLELGETRLDNPPGFDGPFFARIESARIRVKLLPLLERKVVMDTVSLGGLQVNLVRREDGTTNWEDLSPTRSRGDNGTGNAPEDAKRPPELAALAVNGVELRDAALTLEDHQKDTRYEIRDLSLTTGSLFAGQTFPVETAFQLNGEHPGFKARIRFRADAQLNPDAASVQLGNTDLALDLDSQELDIEPTQVSLQGTVSGDLSGQRWTIQEMRLGVAGSQTGKGLQKASVDMRGDLEVDLNQGLVVLDSLDAELAARLEQPSLQPKARLTGQVQYEIPKRLLTSPNLSLELTTPEPGPGIQAMTTRFQGPLTLNLADQTLRAPDLTLELDLKSAPDQPGGDATLKGSLAANVGTRHLELQQARLEGRFSDPTRGIRQGRLDGQGDVALDLEPLNVNVTALKVTADLQTDPARARGLSRLQTELGGDPAYRGGLGQLKIPDLALDWTATTEKGRMQATGSLRTALSLNTGLSSVNAGKLQLNLDVTGSQVPGAHQTVTASGDVALDLKAQTLDATGVELGVSKLVNAKVSLKAQQIMDTPRFQGALAIAQFNPRKLMASLGLQPPASSDDQVLRKASLSGAFNGDTRNLSLSKLRVNLDDSTLTGQVDLTRLDARPAARFNLSLDQMDLDRYRPSRPPTRGPRKAVSPATSSPPAEQPEELPLVRIADLDADGNLSVGELWVNRVRLRQAQLKFKAHQGVAHLDIPSGRVFGGDLVQHGVLDVTGKTPRIDAEFHLHGTKIGKLLQHMRGEERLSGRAYVDGTIQVRGSRADQLKKTLNGDVSFQVQDGALKGVDLGNMIRRAKAVVRRRRLPQDQSLQTDFTELTGTARITDGVVSNEDLQAKSPLLRVAGKGTVDLVREELDYTVKVALVETSKGQGGRDISDLRRISIPIHFTGSLDNPEYSLDPGKLLADKAKQRLQERLEKRLGAEPATQRPVDELKRRIFERLLNR